MNHLYGKWVRRAFTGLVLATLTLAPAGCLAIGGTDHFESVKPTLGKQLQDLKMARDNGAITDTEYQQAKAKVLNGGT